MHNQKLGQEGERMALEFLLGKGYRMLFRNYRQGRGEIDLIMQMDQLLVFVEVKTRSNTDYGEPEEAVNFRIFPGKVQYASILYQFAKLARTSKSSIWKMR